MKKLFIIIFILFAGTCVAEALKKIEIIESNNGTFAYKNTDHIFPKPDQKYLISLRKYIEAKGFLVKTKDEFSFIKKALKWSSSQWKHDGMNQPQKGLKP